MPARQRWKFAVIAARSRGLVVAFEPHVSDAHIWKNVREWLHHPESGAQDRNDHERVSRDHLASHPLKWCVNCLPFGLDVPRRFNREDQAQVIRQRPKRRRFRRLVTQVRDEVSRERVIEFVYHCEKTVELEESEELEESKTEFGGRGLKTWDTKK